MDLDIRRQSSSGPDRGPRPVPGLGLAMVALSFTLILIQVDAAAQGGGASGMVAVLIAALLAMVGVASSGRPGT